MEPRPVVSQENNSVDADLTAHHTSPMKYFPHFLFACATALSLASSGEGGTVPTETQVGPHSEQKFVLVPHAGRTFNERDPNYAKNIALVLKIEQRMVKGGQEITATLSAHKDGPNGALKAVDQLRVHVTQPVDFGTQPANTAGAHITQTIPAPGGKFRTVTAEGTFDSHDYAKAYVSLTVPGDK